MTTAAKILGLLADKHAGDVFVRECKNGPSQMTTHLRIDAWAMKRSWSKPCVTAYEVKVSRADFLRDDKWPGYLPYSNQFYFVAPSGVVLPDELPAEVGLLLVSQTGTKLYTKKKAQHRAVDIPESLFRYILMSRAVIRNERGIGVSPNPGATTSKEFWEDWLKEKKIDREFGYMVGKTMHQRFKQEVHAVRNENNRLKLLVASHEKVQDFLCSIGLDPNDEYINTRMIQRRINNTMAKVPPDLARGIMMIAERAAQLKECVDRLTTPEDGDRETAD